MSPEHSHALSEIRPDVMNALLKHASAIVAYAFLTDPHRHHQSQEIHPHEQHYRHAMKTLRTLGVLNENGNFDLTLAEYNAINAFYDDEIARWQAATFQENAPEAAAFPPI